jgi:hypothetical protein
MIPVVQASQLTKNITPTFCHSERSEESLLDFSSRKEREIPRFARTDKTNYFLRSLFSLRHMVLPAAFSGMVVSRSGIRGRDVILSVLVLVFEREIRILDDPYGFKKSGRVGNRHCSSRGLQVFRQAALVPYIQLIAAIGNIRDSHPAISIRHAKVRRVDCNDRSAHFRVNVAEKKTHTGTVEVNRLAGPCFVKSKVESFAVKERENIMQEGILVGKLDRCPNLNNEDVRIETLIHLRNLRRGMARCRRGNSYRSRCERRKPNHDFRQIDGFLGRNRLFHRLWIYDFHLDRNRQQHGLGQQGASPEANESEDRDSSHWFKPPH